MTLGQLTSGDIELDGLELDHSRPKLGHMALRILGELGCGDLGPGDIGLDLTR